MNREVASVDELLDAIGEGGEVELSAFGTLHSEKVDDSCLTLTAPNGGLVYIKTDGLVVYPR